MSLPHKAFLLLRPFCNVVGITVITVLTPQFFMAKSRMALRFIVKFAAFADGTTVIPCFS
jgi:hypothetical protein